MGEGKARIAALLAAGLTMALALSSIAVAQQPDVAKAREEKKIMSYEQPDA